jgi:DNA repair protein RadC
MSIKDWPDEIRPREKLLKYGPEALSDAELMAIFIRNGSRGQSALDISHELFIQLGSWNNILTVDQKVFCRIPGLGIAKYIELQAISEVNRRCAQEPLLKNNILKNTQATYRFLRAKMENYRREVFACLFLNNAYHLISFQELFYGTINMTNVHSREVVKAALDCNAVAVIAVHNHPSGQVVPSEADIHVTHYLKRALALMEINLLDHIIIGKGGATSSFKEQGLL